LTMAGLSKTAAGAFRAAEVRLKHGITLRCKVLLKIAEAVRVARLGSAVGHDDKRQRA
jgi:hypothetical protein